MAMEPMDSQEVPEFDYRQLDFGALAPLVDVIYGAVIGYPIFLFGELLAPLFVQGEASIQWVNVALVGFVLLYSLSDAVETRIMTDRFPYKGRRRFSIDLGIALVFFLAFAGAAKGSPNFLIPFAVIFLLGGLWGMCLDRETRPLWRWRYPLGVFLTHLGAAWVWLLYWWLLSTRGVTELGWVHTGWLLAYYLAWLAIATAAREIYGVPPIDTDLFPTSLVEIGARKVMRFLRKYKAERS